MKAHAITVAIGAVVGPDMREGELYAGDGARFDR